jgi:hypothetical protein
MIHSTGFFLTGFLDAIDFHEFIRHRFLSEEHLMSAKHFLQRDTLLGSNVEMNIEKWYSLIYDKISSFLTSNNEIVDISFNDEIRHEIVGNSSIDEINGLNGAMYYKFMKFTVLPEIKIFQEKIRMEVR